MPKTPKSKPPPPPPISQRRSRARSRSRSKSKSPESVRLGQGTLFKKRPSELYCVTSNLDIEKGEQYNREIHFSGKYKTNENGFVYDEVKKKWVVSKQVVGARGVSFKAMTSTNDGNSLEMLMSHDHKKKKINHISPGGEGDGIRRTHSDVSITSDGTGGTGMSGLTGMESEFTFNAVGTDYSTARTRSETTIVSTGIAIPSLPTKSGAVGAAAAEGIEVSDLDRNIMLTDSEDLSIGSSTDGGHSDAGHIDGAIGYGGDERSEPGMIVPKKTVRRLLPQSNTIKEDSPFDEGGGIPFDERSRGGRSFTAGRISPKPVVGRFTSPKKPVPNFDNSSRQFIRRNRKPSFGRRL